MTARARTGLGMALLGAALGVGIVACTQAPAPSEATPATTAASAAAPPPSAVPADHLAPGELVEGPDKAFGIPLPREVHLEWDHPGSVRAIGPVSVHSLVRYYRTRIAQGTRNEGDTFAELDDVKLAGHPGQVFRIRMTELPPKGTLLELDDVTPPPAPDLPNEEARWRQVGLTPQGKLLDPTHL